MNYESIDKCFIELLQTLSESKYAQDGKELSLFYPLCGTNYEQNIMVVGRAVNGWFLIEPFLLKDIDYLTKKLRETKSCNLSWVTNTFGKGDSYRSSKSAFWRVIRNIVIQSNFHKDENDWVQSIVWSNLYKLSPSSFGNPSTHLANLQFESCKDLLRYELLLYKPKLLLFITGLDWCKPFIEQLEPKNVNKKINKTVEQSCEINIDKFISPIKTIITSRPEARNETEFVNNVLLGINSL